MDRLETDIEAEYATSCNYLYSSMDRLETATAVNPTATPATFIFQYG